MHQHVSSFTLLNHTNCEVLLRLL